MAVLNRKTVQKISRGLRSRYPLFYVLGWEEERIERLLRSVAKSYYSGNGELIVWSANDGFMSSAEDETTSAPPVVGSDAAADLRDPIAALRAIAESDRPALYLMKDLPVWFEANPALVRAVRDLYYRLKQRNIHVFLSHPQLILPEILKKELFLIDMDLPSEEEIVETLSQSPNVGDTPRDHLYRFAAAMRGLSLNEVGHLSARIFRGETVALDATLGEIQEEKSQLLRKESCLRFYPPQRNLDDIGGLENLKEWVLKRADLFSEEAYEAGVPLPSGVLFMGVSGCGKSMAAKAIAAAWQLPLVRMDMSLVLSGSFGTPEYAFEQATRMAEEVSPIVLWVDEIENAFGYDDHGGGGGGGHNAGNVNIFSSFLTWLQEKDQRVFVAATANRIQALPAELMRKGRFDQLFFLDLPHKDERKEIFRIHITANGGNPKDFNFGYLAASTKEWSGAEIEQAVKSARIDAYQQDRPFNERDVVNNIVATIPLSRTMVEQIKAIKDWCFKRAITASRPAPREQ
jgi:ATP-dependent 26S proteasome regulatory subunit